MTKMLMCVAAIVLLSTPLRAGPLHDAVKAGDAATVKQLIERGEDINKMILASALRSTKLPWVERAKWPNSS